MKTFMQKADKTWIGLLAGIIVPGLVFMFYWLLFYHKMNFPHRFVHYLLGGNLLSNVIKLCVLFNLAVFYLGLKYESKKFNVGIIVSIALYIGLIAYINYALEQDLG